MKIKEYTIVSSRNDNGIRTMERGQFSEIINKMISEGWQPIGGITVDNCSRPEALQAMVKYEDPEYYVFCAAPGNIEAQEESDKAKRKERKVVEVFRQEFSTFISLVEKRSYLQEKGWSFVRSFETPTHFHALEMVKYDS